MYCKFSIISRFYLFSSLNSSNRCSVEQLLINALCRIFSDRAVRRLYHSSLRSLVEQTGLGMVGDGKTIALYSAYSLTDQRSERECEMDRLCLAHSAIFRKRWVEHTLVRARELSTTIQGWLPSIPQWIVSFSHITTLSRIHDLRDMWQNEEKDEYIAPPFPRRYRENRERELIGSDQAKEGRENADRNDYSTIIIQLLKIRARKSKKAIKSALNHRANSNSFCLFSSYQHESTYRADSIDDHPGLSRHRC